MERGKEKGESASGNMSVVVEGELRKKGKNKNESKEKNQNKQGKLDGLKEEFVDDGSQISQNSTNGDDGGNSNSKSFSSSSSSSSNSNRRKKSRNINGEEQFEGGFGGQVVGNVRIKSTNKNKK